jgi:hypothetical protein
VVEGVLLDERNRPVLLLLLRLLCLPLPLLHGNSPPRRGCRCAGVRVWLAFMVWCGGVVRRCRVETGRLVGRCWGGYQSSIADATLSSPPTGRNRPVRLWGRG